MEAKELRIGNYINSWRISDNWEIKKIEHGKELDFIFMQEQNNIYRPIPLTDEWLLKFAFELSLDNWYLKGGANGGSFWLFKVNYDEKYRVSMVEKTISYVKYVHQLQNLFFALTMEELKLKS